jgi:hypothetical protein
MIERARILTVPASAVVLVFLTAGCGEFTTADTARVNGPPAKERSEPANATQVAVNQSAPGTNSKSSDWRRFRGPNGSGVSDVTGLPTKWSATENLVWKRRLPGAGASSPIVVGDRIYVTCYSGYGLSKESPGEPKDLRRHLVCVDRKTGRVLWDTKVRHERLDHGYSGFMQLHGYASSTPVSDGERNYAYFGNWGAYAFDRDGKQQWRFDCGSGVHGFGSGASPVLHGDLVIVNASVEGQALIAINKTSGKEAWRSEKIKDSWSTPVLVKAAGRVEVVLPTGQRVMSFDAKTGRTLWKFVGEKGTTYTCPSLVHHKGVLYGLPSYNGPVAAIRAGGTGDVSKSHAVWTSPHFRTTVVSPALHDGFLYYPHDEGGYMASLDAATGAEKKRVRARPGFGRLYASPLIAGGRIYVVTRTKGTFVFKAEPGMEQVAHNTIAGDDSIFNASPVAHDGRLLLRSDRFLYCIGR